MLPQPKPRFTPRPFTLLTSLLLLAGLFVATVVVAQDSRPDSRPGEKEEAKKKEAEKKQPERKADPKPRVAMKTNRGTIVIELDREKAPITVANFLRYAREGFYEGTIFHRVIPTFMIQGGGFDQDMNRKKTRSGIKNEWQNGLKNVRGTIAMARLGRQPNSATSQFFINVKDNAALDLPNDGAGYAVFGRVVDGMNVVDEIKNVETKVHPKLAQMGKVVPMEPVIIESVTRVKREEKAEKKEK